MQVQLAYGYESAKGWRLTHYRHTDGIRVGPFVVHEKDDKPGWHVTHARTGYRIPVPGTCCLTSAMGLARALEAIHNWDFDDPNVTVGWRDAAQVALRWNCPRGCDGGQA